MSSHTIRRGILYALFAVAISWSVPARALSRRGAMYLRNCESTLRIARLQVIKQYETAPVDDRIISHWKNLKRNLYRVIRTFNRIPAGDFSDPRVQQLKTRLMALEAHLKALDAHVKAHEAQVAALKKRFFAFQKKFGHGPYVQAMQQLRNMQGKSAGRAIRSLLPRVRPLHPGETKVVLTNTDGKHFAQFRDHLLEIRKACTGEFRGLKNYSYYAHSFRSNYEAWCRMVNQMEKILHHAVKAAAAYDMNEYTKALRKMEAQLKRDPTEDLYTEQVLWVLHPELVEKPFAQMIAAWAKLTGLQLNAADYLNDWRQAVPALRSAIMAQLRPNRKFIKHNWTSHYRPAEKMAKKAIRAIYHSRVKWVAMLKNKWDIFKNRYGIPDHRYRHGIAIFKVRGEPFCRAVTFSYRQAYRGGGRFQRKATLEVSRAAMRPTACR